MKKELKDYLHLYLGCECRCFCNEDTSGWPDKITLGLLMEYADPDSGLFISPILRPLSSMTEEECDQFGIHYTEGKYNRQCFEADATYGGTFRVYSIESISDRVNQMRNAGIDCDGLIESGLAINAETLK